MPKNNFINFTLQLLFLVKILKRLTGNIVYQYSLSRNQQILSYTSLYGMVKVIKRYDSGKGNCSFSLRKVTYLIGITLACRDWYTHDS